MTLVYVMIALLWAAQAGDVWTTYRFLKLGGREGNPVAVFLFKHTGWFGILSLKTLFSALATGFVIHWPNYWFFLVLPIKLGTYEDADLTARLLEMDTA